MILDYATKPLQGALFRKFRDQIMGVVPAKNSGPGKTDHNIGKSATAKRKTDRNIGKSAAAKSKPKGKERRRVWSRQVKGGTTGACWESSTCTGSTGGLEGLKGESLTLGSYFKIEGQIHTLEILSSTPPHLVRIL
jgi:hypothetical protein